MDRPQDSQSGIPELSEALGELANLMLATPSLTGLLDDAARLAASVITPPAACGITLREDHHPLTVASSDAVAAHVDEVQYGDDQGPCLQAMRTGEPVQVSDMSAEHRWGSYSAHALAYGVHSSLSLPLTVNGHSQGALNLYATTPQAFGSPERQRAELFAAQVSAALTVVVRQAHQVQLTEQLRDALSSRAVIDQALGILMAQNRCDHNTAFDHLRSASQHQNRKLRDIATDIVEAISGHNTEPARFNDPPETTPR